MVPINDSTNTMVEKVERCAYRQAADLIPEWWLVGSGLMA